MTYAIIYSSKTGNTELLADVIRQTLPEENCVWYGPVSGAAGASGNADMIFAGFWTDIGTCDEAMAGFLRGLAGKEVFLFGTAGFGQSEDYFSQILGKVGSHLDKSCHLAGTFMCQGKMPESVRRRYEGMLESGGDERKVKGLIENFDRALSHPDEGDEKRLREAVLEIMGRG